MTTRFESTTYSALDGTLPNPAGVDAQIYKDLSALVDQGVGALATNIALLLAIDAELTRRKRARDEADQVSQAGRAPLAQ
jgi:hypothetical protein